MINWRKVLRYALAIFATQFLIGFLEGLILPQATGGMFSAQGIASSTISLLLCAAIFAHLAIHQVHRTYEHAALALLVQSVLSASLAVAVASWLATASTGEIGVETLILLAACALGTFVGTRLRDRHAARAAASQVSRAK